MGAVVGTCKTVTYAPVATVVRITAIGVRRICTATQVANEAGGLLAQEDIVTLVDKGLEGTYEGCAAKVCHQLGRVKLHMVAVYPKSVHLLVDSSQISRTDIATRAILHISIVEPHSRLEVRTLPLLVFPVRHHVHAIRQYIGIIYLLATTVDCDSQRVRSHCYLRSSHTITCKGNELCLTEIVAIYIAVTYANVRDFRREGLVGNRDIRCSRYFELAIDNAGSGQSCIPYGFLHFGIQVVQYTFGEVLHVRAGVLGAPLVSRKTHSHDGTFVVAVGEELDKSGTVQTTGVSPAA